jgi:peptide-methionine (S)-S-oxide reductase
MVVVNQVYSDSLCRSTFLLKCQVASTEIIPATTFYLAEDYHQKYRLRQSPTFMSEFATIYPDPADFVSSTAAARVNGYLGGYGTLADLQAEIDDLGLSPAAQEELLDIVRGRQR